VQLRTISFSITILFSFALVLCLAFVNVPRIIKSTGYTTGTMSIAKVNTSISGVLASFLVADQARVKQGEVLGEVTSERFMGGHSLDAEQASITEHKLKLDSQELRNIKISEQATDVALRLKIDADRIQLESISQELQMAGLRRVDLERQMARQEFLVGQGFVSVEAVEQKRNELLAQKIGISTLERNHQQLNADIVAQQQELILNNSRSQTQRSLIQREIESLQQERNEHLAKRIQLVAPIDGVVTQISATVGQTVRPELPVLTIVPISGLAEVLLLVPSRSIGFVRVGQKVSVRYQAYPYEHYGRHWGVVKEIAQAALPPQEVVQQIKVDEPVYTVRVSLPSNYLEYQGKHLSLTPGMVVEADVELDRLKIYQWLLEPLYRLGARV
jgi:membrane fusion protein